MVSSLWILRNSEKVFLFTVQTTSKRETYSLLNTIRTKPVKLNYYQIAFY